DRLDLLLGDAGGSRCRKMRLELERSAVEDGDPKDRELAQIGWQRVPIADRGQELFPPIGQRCAVEKGPIKERDASALGNDRLLDRGELRPGTRLDQRN